MAIPLCRIQGRLELLEKEDPPVEYRFRLDDPWSRKLFTALCRRYDVRTYRYRGQKRSYLNDITERVIAEAIHKDISDAAEVEAPRGLPAGVEK